jgi:hypothetical protein
MMATYRAPPHHDIPRLARPISAKRSAVRVSAWTYFGASLTIFWSAARSCPFSAITYQADEADRPATMDLNKPGLYRRTVSAVIPVTRPGLPAHLISFGVRAFSCCLDVPGFWA